MADSSPNNVLKRTPSPYVLAPELQEAVDKYKSENPLKIKLAEQFGEYLMSTRFANTDDFKVDTGDSEGETILYKQLIKKIEYYGLPPSEFLPFELELLRRRLGQDWITQLKETYGYTTEDFDGILV